MIHTDFCRRLAARRRSSDQGKERRLILGRDRAKTDIASAPTLAAQQSRRIRQRRTLREMQKDIGRIGDQSHQDRASLRRVGEPRLTAGFVPLLQSGCQGEKLLSRSFQPRRQIWRGRAARRGGQGNALAQEVPRLDARRIAVGVK